MNGVTLITESYQQRELNDHGNHFKSTYFSASIMLVQKEYLPTSHVTYPCIWGYFCNVKIQIYHMGTVLKCM